MTSEEAAPRNAQEEGSAVIAGGNRLSIDADFAASIAHDQQHPPENHQEENQQGEEAEAEAEVAVAAAGDNEEEQDPAELVAQAALAQELLGQNNDYVGMGRLFRNGSFLQIIYSFPVIISLIISLIIDWKRGCSSCSCPPLRQWAIAQIVVQSLVALVNSDLIRRLIISPLVADHTRSFKVMSGIGRVIDLIWFVCFIIGAVWTFQYRNFSCKQTTPFLYATSYAIIITDFILTGLAIFLCFCSCGFIIFRESLIRRMRLAAQQQTQGISQEAIHALPSMKYEPGLLESSDSSCAICLCDYNTGDLIRFLPCSHHFHAQCVDEWLAVNKTCPFCKHPSDQPYSGPIRHTPISLSISPSTSTSATTTTTTTTTTTSSNSPTPSTSLLQSHQQGIHVNELSH